MLFSELVYGSNKPAKALGIVILKTKIKIISEKVLLFMSSFIML